MEDVSFHVPRGEVAALLGPNGSGKSTVLRAITGFFSPTAGSVRVGGIEVGEDSIAARRLIGYLPEQVALYPDLTVRRYLTFVAGMRGLGRRAVRRAVGRAIEEANLAEVADRSTGKLSKGFRQRVGLAQALIADPPVLVLDEPTVGLDPVQTVDMRALLGRMRERTVLLSTHVLSEASALCSRVIVLARGRVVAEDSAEGLGRRVEGLGRVVARVEGPAPAIAARLAALAGVTGIEPLAAAPGTGAAFALAAADPAAVQRQVAAAMVAEGWTLLELRLHAPTLEDLFVRLVGPGASPGS